MPIPSISQFFLIFVLFLGSIPYQLFATHQRAAEITYRHIDGLTYEITLISYTFTLSPANAFRDYLIINWGDNSISEIPRVEIIELPNDISFNKYIGRHTFPGPSTYVISCEDPNRNGGILNIPNSINVPLFIYSELVINPFIGGYNNSPVLLLPPIDNACVEQPFYHNPGAFDPDGDSLSYKLVNCYGAQGFPIPGYTLPPATKSITLDSITGDFYWDSPPQQGEYNIAILIEEWRDGVKIGSVLRDMQIIVIACNNLPPVINPLQDTCVEAEEPLTFYVSASDPDNNIITLTGTGGPFLMTPKAFINPDPAVDTGFVSTRFRWNTTCDHIRLRTYQVFFKAKDNSHPVNLVDIKSMNILVVGPAPENLTATPLGNSITLNWDNYPCNQAAGYLIYRNDDSTGFIHDYCETGVPGYLGYQLIDKLTDINQLTYLDDNNGQGLFQGIKYCYMIVAYYPDKAEGYASNEACATLRKDVPVITHASIRKTSTTVGSTFVGWSKPTDIDTLIAPGPYKYLISMARSDQPGLFTVIDSLPELNDTTFLDTLRNTQTFYFIYRIDMYNDTPGQRFLIGSSNLAATMFLSIEPTDKKLRLSWNVHVPWINSVYTIYRVYDDGNEPDSVGQSTIPQFTAEGLKNGITYCFDIKSTGSYSASGFIHPILNRSQINCGIPEDNVPPCPPVLTIVTACDQSVNKLTWSNPRYDTCTQDIVKYYIYFAPDSGQPLQIIDTLFGSQDTTYEHAPYQSIVGCYAVMAVDSVGNHSGLSNQICINVDACPLYRLPKVFTPNGDGINDFFVPFDYTSVESINLNMFDRWGRKVFETHDPRVLWDGKDKMTNQPCSDGVYFYVCDIYEITLTGTIKRSLHGSVTILR